MKGISSPTKTSCSTWFLWSSDITHDHSHSYIPNSFMWEMEPFSWKRNIPRMGITTFLSCAEGILQIPQTILWQGLESTEPTTFPYLCHSCPRFDPLPCPGLYWSTAKTLLSFLSKTNCQKTTAMSSLSPKFHCSGLKAKNPPKFCYRRLINLYSIQHQWDWSGQTQKGLQPVFHI